MAIDGPPRSDPPAAAGAFGGPSLERPSLEQPSLERLPADPAERFAPLFFVVLFVLALGALALVVGPFTGDFVLAFMVVAAVRRPYERLKRVVRGRAVFASTIVTAGFVLIATVPAALTVAGVAMELSPPDALRPSTPASSIDKAFAGDGWIARTVRGVGARFGIALSPELVRNEIGEAATAVGNAVRGYVQGIVENAAMALVHFAILIVIVFYLLIDGPRLKRFVYRLSPLPDEEEELLARRFVEVGRAIFVGNGIASAAQGALASLSMVAVGLPAPLLMGMLMTLLAFLPIVGITVAVLPQCLYLLVEGRPGAALFHFTFCVTQASIIENVLKARLIGQRAGLHGLLIFISMIGGIWTFGVMGFIYGPLIVSGFEALSDLYEKNYKARLVDLVRRSRESVQSS